MRCYSHLSDAEREQIGLAKAVGHSIGAIAKAIGRPKSTVSRELLRNRLPSGRYSPLHAAGGLSGKPSCQRHARFALMENEHWPCTLTNDEVTLPVAALGSGLDMLGPFVDGDATLDGILRRSRSARAAAFVMAREVTP